VSQGEGERTTACAVLTPYLIPPALQGKKVCNLGDGFILRAIERHLGRFSPSRCFSPRVPLPAEEVAELARAPATILAGANQLATNWTIWPGLASAALRASAIRPIPFGIGLHGMPGHDEHLSTATKELLLAMHDRIAFSSWRCPRTVELLTRELPQLAPQLLMTGCPVVFDRPLLNGVPFPERADHIAVTVTERGDFEAREYAVLDHVAARFPQARRSLVLHQDFSPPTRLELLRHRFWPWPSPRHDACQRLRRHAVRAGYRIVVVPDCDALARFYAGVDVHIGSRLHAHLRCLSQARRSWLVPVDGRAAGIAESLDFPLCEPTELGKHADFDFERVRRRALALFPVMQRFVRSLPT
jgi:hypothetical protein